MVFVDDGSRDGTGSVLQTIRAELGDRVKVLALQENSGKAEAVRRGILTALENDPENVGFWDADLSTPLDAINRLVGVLEKRPDVTIVMGSRVKLMGRKIERRAWRHYLGRVFATFASLTLRLPVYDTQCGAKLFRNTRELRGYFEEPFLTRWLFDVEILARATQTDRLRADMIDKDRIYEYPLEEWCDVGGSKLRITDFLLALFELVRIRRRYSG